VLSHVHLAANNSLAFSGSTRSVNHVVELCPLTKVADGGLSILQMMVQLCG